MNEALVPIESQTPSLRISTAADVALACKKIVLATAMAIQGRKYVRVEGWQAIATAHGCVASARDVEVIEGGIRALGQVIRMSDGNVLSTAEGFVGDDESMWAKRPMYARRAMAQTRAISRACRSAFAHVVVMMNAGLETTPAEEISHHEEEAPAPRRNAKEPEIVEDEAPTREALLLQISNLANVMKMSAQARSEWAKEFCGTTDLRNVDVAVLSDLLSALQKKQAGTAA